MIRLLRSDWKLGDPLVLSERVLSEPRLSKAQRDAMLSVVLRDEKAGVEGLDARMRPVVSARLSGPRGRTRYALLRNGDPAKVEGPLTEVWR
jgi:hypothetical protein